MSKQQVGSGQGDPDAIGEGIGNYSANFPALVHPVMLIPAALHKTKTPFFYPFVFVHELAPHL